MQFDNQLRNIQFSGNKINFPMIVENKLRYFQTLGILLYLGPLKALQSIQNTRIILNRRTVVDKRLWVRASFSDSTYEINIAMIRCYYAIFQRSYVQTSMLGVYIVIDFLILDCSVNA